MKLLNFKGFLAGAVAESDAAGWSGQSEIRQKPFRETIMKKLAFFALSVVASAAFAAGSIDIDGVSSQTANIATTTISNWANGARSDAFQNFASNSGNVTVTLGGRSEQLVTTSNFSNAVNEARVDAVAQQNVSSNVGDLNRITISGASIQRATLNGTTLRNTATGDNVAQQSVTSNVGDVDISGSSTQIASLTNSTLTNTATSKDALAIQNIASNHSCNAFTCTRMTWHK